MYLADKQKADEKAAYYERINREERDRIIARQEAEDAAKKAEQERIAAILERIPGIVCWGDSLTAGAGGSGTTYPNVLAKRLADGGYATTVVKNMGVGGESTQGIMARAGALDILLSSELVIPAKREAVQVTFAASNGSGLALLRQGSGGASNVTIKGIEGTLSIQQESYLSKEYSYWFTRKRSGRETVVPAGTQIVNDGSVLYTDYIPVIFMGQNGGWGNDPQQLIQQQQAILDTCGKNQKNFIILGLTSGTAESRRALETAMAEHWGKQYINLREALCNQAWIESFDLKCTDSDIASIQKGEVPQILRTDGVHFNATGYTMIGNLLFDRLVELGFVEK